jgi:HlyD family secretion protein
MTCQVEIIVEQYADVVYVPIQTVLRVGGQPTVYVLKGGQLEARPVELGLNNNRMVRIVSGLEPGEAVLLKPPLAPATKPPEERIAEPPQSGSRDEDKRPQPGPRDEGRRPQPGSHDGGQAPGMHRGRK